MEATKSTSASTIRLAIVFLVCIVILAPSVTARTMAEAPSPVLVLFDEDDSSFSNCAPFILEATMCVVDVIKLPVASHPSCCKAISDLNDCAPQIYQHIPDMDVIKKICGL
uniref:Prolamin-like domain-containing protein n=1 Tax=Cucumis sativus TaxID=3659 RepID=A0A0A0LTD6_CUCSA